MDLKTLLWYGVLSSITLAYLVALFGVKAAHQHDVTHHSRRMIIACTIVGIWLIAYVLKQLLFGREHFGGTERQYWTLYAPLFSTHMALAITTIGLGAYNPLYGAPSASIWQCRGYGSWDVAPSPPGQGAGLDLFWHDGDSLRGVSHAVSMVPRLTDRFCSRCRVGQEWFWLVR